MGSWQQTDTHWVVPVLVMVTMAVEVSAVPLPTSVPGAAPPPFWSTPNHGTAPISNALLAGLATIEATLPGVTEAVTVALVDPAAPLTLTEHQLRKFFTVSVTCVGGGALEPPHPIPIQLTAMIDAIPRTRCLENFGAGFSVCDMRNLPLSLSAPQSAACGPTLKVDANLRQWHAFCFSHAVPM